MLKYFREIKRAIRFQKNEQGPMAVLELDAIIDQNEDMWLARVLRARARMEVRRYDQAIADCIQVLVEPNCSLSKRNRVRLLDWIVECSLKLSNGQQKSLYKTLRDSYGLDTRFLLPKEQPAKRRTPPAPRPVSGAVYGRLANIGKFLLDQRDLEKIAYILSQPPQPGATGIRRLNTYG